MSVHTTYGSTDLAVYTLNFIFFKVNTQLYTKHMHEKQFKLFTAFHQQLSYISNECQLSIAHSVFKHSVQNVHQLQQHMYEVC